MSDQDEQQPMEWGPAKTSKGRARLPSSRRRVKPQLSCNLCRRRKLRCDRRYPCGSCANRGLSQSCTYASNASRVLDGAQRAPGTMHERIQHLESLVVDLMQHTSASHSVQENGVTPGLPSPMLTAGHSAAATPNEDLNDNASTASECGSIQLTKTGASYVSSAHWAAVLDGIAEIKDHFEKEEEAQAASPGLFDNPHPDWTGPQLLYGCTKLSKEEILESIPTRPIVDRLVSRYFNSFEMSPAVLHSVQFLKEYEEFWENPSATPVIWLGLLFAIMCLAAQFQKFRLDPGVQTPEILSMEQDLEYMMGAFREKIVQCLVLGNYTKGGPCVLETLMLYIAVEVFISKDAEIGIWILMGTLVQLAMHMGYHRDPKHFKDMSLFESEMRKRAWTTIVEMDLGISAQMGLPRLIKQSHTDTKGPSNLQDADFDKATTEMPPSRSEADLTPILYRIVKARVTNALGSIWDFAADIRPHSYTEITKMDAMLQDAHEGAPSCLKWRSMTHCIADSPQVIMQKLFLEIIFYRARIVLHRKSLHCSPTKAQYDHSKQTCLNAALKLLEYQHIVQEEIQPFGRLYQDRWRVSSMINHDFLLATSILCSYLQQARDKAHEDTETSMTKTIRESLKRSHRIWRHSSNSSKEAQKAAEALNVILGSYSIAEVDSNTENNTPLEGLSLPTYSNYLQENPAGFDVQLPVFDATMPSNWALPTNESTDSLPAAMTATNSAWRMTALTDTMSFL